MPVIYETSRLPGDSGKRLAKRLLHATWSVETIRVETRGVERELRKLFRRFTLEFKSRRDLFVWIAGHYDRTHRTSGVKDYPYYLFSMFFMEGESLAGAASRESGVEGLTELDVAVERLLVMVPRDVARGALVEVRSAGGDTVVGIDDESEAMKIIRNFDRHYGDFCRKSMFQGASYLTQATYGSAQEGYVPVGCSLGPWEGRPEVRTILFSERIQSSSQTAGLPQIMSAAQFTLLELMRGVAPHERPYDDRSKLFALFIALTTFMSERYAQYCPLCEFAAFHIDFLEYVRANVFIGSQALSRDPDSDADAQSDEQERLLRRIQYEKGAPAQKLFDSSEQMEEELQLDTVIASGTDPEIGAAGIVPGIQIDITEEDVTRFLDLLLGGDHTARPRNPAENLAELGFTFDGLLALPALSPPTIRIRLLLALDRVTRSALGGTSAGHVRSQLGIRFERYVENYLEAAGFSVIRSLNVDPDVIAVHDGTLYAIECKAWLEDVEYVVGVEYVPRFLRRKKDIEKARAQAVRWADRIPVDVLRKAGQFETIRPVVVVPYAVHASPYTDVALTLTDVPVVTVRDLVALVRAGGS